MKYDGDKAYWPGIEWGPVSETDGNNYCKRIKQQMEELGEKVNNSGDQNLWIKNWKCEYNANTKSYVANGFSIAKNFQGVKTNVFEGYLSMIFSRVFPNSWRTSIPNLCIDI